MDLDSDRGQLILKRSKEQGMSKFDKISPHFRKQTWKSFCGIQSVCTVLNTLDCSPPGHTLYLEAMFWEYSISKVVEESVVRRQGMSLEQCAAILNSCPGITATPYRTDETTLTTFRQQVEQVMTTQNSQVRTIIVIVVISVIQRFKARLMLWYLNYLFDISLNIILPNFAFKPSAH